jgi:nucleotide-binding universal stress UspA family protein
MTTGEHNATTWVVVGVDGSPESDSAIRFAAREARRRGAGLRLVHVLPAFPAGVVVGLMATEEPTPTGRALLSEASSIARSEAADVPMECRLLAGDRCDAIIEAAQDAAEIVLGHDPTPTLRRLATGSTVIRVAGHAPVPVIAVAPGPLAEPRAVVAVGIKNPDKADPMLRLGFEVAAERGASAWFLHTWEFPPGYERLASTPAERDELARLAAAPMMQTFAALAAEHPGVEHRLDVRYGNPARTLEEASRGCDLLVLARRAHVVPRGHIGGTARALLHHAACPVMFVAGS